MSFAHFLLSLACLFYLTDIALGQVTKFSGLVIL